MLFRLLSGGDIKQALIGLVLSLPAILLCLTVHETCHGAAAYALGDDTARRQGRLTLDPMAHLDPAGFFCMLIFGFGWARPVPVNISNLTRLKNRRTSMALVAFAGPLSNLVLAFLCYLIAIPLMLTASTNNMFLYAVTLFLTYTASLSIGLGVFNLIPVYPLDGSRILDAVLPFDVQNRMHDFVRRYQSIIMLIVIFIVWRGGLSGLIGVVGHGVQNLAYQLLRLFGLF